MSSHLLHSSRLRLLLAPAALSLVLLLPRPAGAKATKNLAYPFRTIWSTTIRLIRVDRGYKITDKDRDNGFILFVYPGTGSVKKCVASLEFIQTKSVVGTPQIRLSLNIQHQPSWVAIQFLDKLERKIRNEQGPPPPPSAPKRPKPPTKKKPETKADKAPLEHRAVKHSSPQKTA